MRHKLTEKENADRKKYHAEYRATEQLHVLDNVNTVEGIAAKAAEIKPDLVIVDYIQSGLDTVEKTENERVRINRISAKLKALAKNSNCHVMALSQIARSDSKMPTMSQLKESGNLEANGDYIMLIHRPFVGDKSKGNPEETKLILDKNKYGQTGFIDMRFDGEYQTFSEFETRYDLQDSGVRGQDSGDDERERLWQ
jgi:replicative DNA helicase